MTWESSARPSTCQPLSTMTVHSRTADVYSSKDTENLQPVLPSSMDHKFPKKWERPSAESPGHKVKDQKDFFKEVTQEKEGLQMKSHFQKQLSPESSRKVALESKAEHWEEELSWERRRQQWLEEEMWLQWQEKWALLERDTGRSSGSGSRGKQQGGGSGDWPRSKGAHGGGRSGQERTWREWASCPPVDGGTWRRHHWHLPQARPNLLTKAGGHTCPGPLRPSSLPPETRGP